MKPVFQNLQELINGTVGSETVLGIILEHPTEGKAVLVDIDRRNNSCTVYFASQQEGFNNFRTILYNLERYTIIQEFSMDKTRQAMKLLLS